MTTDLVPHAGVLALPEEQQARILQVLGLDMKNPLTQALLLVAARYDLDPLLKQVQLIKGSVYVTHAGLLHVAHMSGKLDGIVVEDEGLDTSHYWAKVTVYRNDMKHGFSYKGEYAKSKVRSDGASGREMALKNAERSALRRAFDICAPTMDDSGHDFDDIPPGGDIDLPPGKPALPAVAAAIPVPEVAPPKDVPAIPTPSTTASNAAPPVVITRTTTASGASGGSVPAPRIPSNATKVVDPETGEVVHLSPNGHVINEKTGGEVLAATPEQEALQARAREILAQAEAALEAKVPTPGTKRVVKGVAKKAAAKPVPDFTEEQIKRGQSIHMAAKEKGIEETLMRDVIFSVTDKRTRSTREVGHDEADTVKAIMTAIAGDVIELQYDADGTLVFDVEEDNAVIEDAEVVDEPRDWKAAAKKVGVSDGTFLRRARAFAEEMNLPLPSSFKDVGGGPLGDALVEWLKEQDEGAS